MEHTNKKGQKYFLHSKVITLRGGERKQTIYYFGKNAQVAYLLKSLPKGFKVVENLRTGLPVLKRK